MTDLLAAVPLPLYVTLIPALLLLVLGVFFQPVMPARHRDGVRATRIVRQLEAERARQPRPLYQRPPAWTVQTEGAPA